jgi:2-polyprenyl-6-methoxyphenol hydroxylase-like FAD-dependent oxidoreductase
MGGSVRGADVVIAGGGIGGLSAALALHARGIDALVLEAAPEIHPLGVGINIQPGAVGELTRLGLGDALAATAIATAEHRYLDQHGTRLWSQPRGQAAGAKFPQYSMHRGELQMLLADAVRERLGSQSILTGTYVRAVHGIGDRAHVQALDQVIDTEITIEAGVVVGADGLHSAVLAQLHPGQVQLWDAGVGMWRGTSELAEFLDGPHADHGQRRPRRPADRLPHLGPACRPRAGAGQLGVPGPHQHPRSAARRCRLEQASTA